LTSIVLSTMVRRTAAGLEEAPLRNHDWILTLGFDRPRLHAVAPGRLAVWTVETTFELWPGPPLGMTEDCNKRGGRIVGSDGELSCAEVEITKRLRCAGWTAGWFNSFGSCGRGRWGKYMIALSDLPAGAATLIALVRSRTGRTGGVPDVIGWRGKDIVFVESKSPTDSATKQREWLRVAFAAGLTADQFAIVKWQAGRAVGEGARTGATSPAARAAAFVPAKVAPAKLVAAVSSSAGRRPRLFWQGVCTAVAEEGRP
jgi:hypothetical protein